MRSSKSQMFNSLSCPGYGLFLASGWFWSIARWATGFIGAFLANDQTGSARLVQLTGVSMWAPLLFGGIIGGVLSDRFDRRRTLITHFVLLIPLAFVLGMAEMTGQLQLWMVYPFMVATGFGWVIDMTGRRPIMYALVGTERIDNAMALESLSAASGLAIGALVGGTVIEGLGIGQALLTVSGMLGIALLFMLPVPRVKQEAITGDTGVNSFVAALKMLRSERALVSVLGVTIFVDFFFFAATPLVQVVGTDLGAGPSRLGLLAAMIGFGMMGGSLLLARYQRGNRGAYYVCGSFIVLLFAIPFATVPNYWLAAVSLFVASIGLGLFSSTQSTIVMTAVDQQRQGRALGLLSTAIGVLPIGMIALGELAEITNASTAVLLSTITGLIGLTVWLRFRPESWRVSSAAEVQGSTSRNS